MHLERHLAILLLSVLFNKLSLASPLAGTNSTKSFIGLPFNPSGSTSGDDIPGISGISNDVVCAKDKTFFDPRPKTSDCLRAGLELPEEHEPGDFHTGDPQDDYSLPLTRAVKSCMIVVHMNPGQVDKSSWQNMRHVSSEISHICQRGDPATGVTGGSALTGDNGFINVTVTRDPNYRDTPPGIAVLNETAIETY